MSVIKSCVSSIVCHQSAGHRRVQWRWLALYQTESNFRTGLIYFNRCMYQGRIQDWSEGGGGPKVANVK